MGDRREKFSLDSACRNDKFDVHAFSIEEDLRWVRARRLGFSGTSRYPRWHGQRLFRDLKSARSFFKRELFFERVSDLEVVPTRMLNILDGTQSFVPPHPFIRSRIFSLFSAARGCLLCPSLVREFVPRS